MAVDLLFGVQGPSAAMWSGSGAARPLGRALEQAVPPSTPAPPPAAAVPNAVGTPGADRPSSSVGPLGPADGVVGPTAQGLLGPSSPGLALECDINGA